MESLNYTDIVLIGVVLISALVGVARGLMKEILSFVAWIFAVYVAWLFSDQIATQYVSRFISDPSIAYFAAFGLLFLAALFLVGLLNLLIGQLLKSTGLGGFDRMLGMMFGFLRGIIIATLLVFFARFTPLTQLDFWQQSKLVPGFAALGSWGWAHLPPNVQKWIKQGNQQIDGVSSVFQDAVSQGQEQLGSNEANRPNTTASSEERNQMSELGKPQDNQSIQLESLNQSGTSASSQSNLPTNTTSPKQSVNQPALKLESLQ